MILQNSTQVVPAELRKQQKLIDIFVIYNEWNLIDLGDNE